MSLFSVRRTFSTLSLAGLLLMAVPSHAAPWLPYGPYGGDARSFAVDPTNHEHLYLGTLTGWVYESRDSGAHWIRLARVGKRDDLALDHIVVDAQNPKHLIVGAWVLNHPDGGLFQSFDGGATWASQPQMQGQSVRSLTAAPSNPKVIVAGTLNGIFRSRDSGAHWDPISPPESQEIHNVQSLAIDPSNAETVYAGTWHLPWKTMDGGANWANIKQGVIDDSDVFSIIVDPQNPKIVFASACSGIYKSEDAGDRFRKVEGIPSTARRTRVLRQDPQHLEIVFAGTTEGLFRTNDSGRNWKRTTGPELIVNDVFIDPSNTQHMLLATDRGGVLVSEDGGDTFMPSNSGFSARQITAFHVDAQRQGTMYVGLVNDKEWGGVFLSRDGGLTWGQRSEGLRGRDVFSLAQAPDGTLVAGTSHGIFRYEDGFWTRSSDAAMLGGGDASSTTDSPGRTRPSTRGSKGRPAASTRHAPVVAKKTASRNGRTVATHGKTKTPAHATARASARTPVSAQGGAPGSSAGSPPSFDGIVHAIVTVGDRMYAGSSHGLLVSNDSGKGWAPVPSMAGDEWRFLAAEKQTMVAASLDKIMYSNDSGATWVDSQLPPKVLQISAVAVDGKGELWAAGREGVFLSSDHGGSWQTLKNLYVRDVDSLFYDSRSDQILVTANGNATIAYGVEIGTRKVTFWDTGWTLRFLRPVGDHLLGATLFDGIVIQPRMVDSKEETTGKVGAGSGGD